MIDDLLSALVGIEGRYISIKRRVNHVHGNDTYDSTVTFQVDASMDLALQVNTRVICNLMNVADVADDVGMSHELQWWVMTR